MQVTTIGIDLAMNVIQVHGVDAKDKVVFNKPLRRSARAVPDRHGSVCVGPLLGARAQEARAQCTADAGQRGLS
jgi:hypothetical protein